MDKLTTRFDHIVVAANTLAQGVDYINDMLGVTIPFGGEHKSFGTHNHLMRLGDDLFFEVIAINPAQAAPAHPRWFALDDPYIRTQLEQSPRLITWVVNTSNLDRLLQKSAIPMGLSTAVSRGELNWLFAVPEDGALHASGAVPYAMQWLSEPHPARAMADTGCTLQALEIMHSNASWLNTVLESIGAAHLVTINQVPENQAITLNAKIQTPSGLVTLSSL